MQSYFKEPNERYGNTYYSFSCSFRKLAFDIDENPQEIQKYCDLPAIDFLLSDRESTTLTRTHYLEAFAYGDPGVLLAAPGPSLSGLMMRELGTLEQADEFYNILKTHKMQTFFALTEPEKGSDASQIQTRLYRKNAGEKKYIMSGVKSFFGNGAVASMGIVLARIADTPIGIRAVWLTPDILNGFCIEKSTLPLFSLRGAQIAIMKFNDTEIPESQILGNHLSSCENGLLGIIKTFNRLRTGVGALAIGQAQAVYDLTFSLNKKKFNTLKSKFLHLHSSLEAARCLLHQAALKIDDNAFIGYPASLAKVNATQTAEKVIHQCINLCTFEMLIDNPWLLKAYRDVFCWEYMEGTSLIQKKQLNKNLPGFVDDIKKRGKNDDYL